MNQLPIQIDLEDVLAAAPPSGDALKTAALNQHKSKHHDYLQRARAHARRIAAENGTVTINDVWAVCPKPEDAHPNVMGAIFSCPDFVVCGHTKAKRRASHAREVRVYKLK